MAEQIIFGGTQAEKFALLDAINRNCLCELNIMGSRLRTCAAHRMLIEDQRALDGLLFARHIADELLLQEFLLPKSC